MAKIKTSIHKISVASKLDKGATIISSSTNNPDVPGNAQPLADFAASHARLLALHRELESMRDAVKAKLAEVRAETGEYHRTLYSLSSFTEAATKGDPAKMIGAGFGVRATATPARLPAQVQNVRVKTNGFPGSSDLDWPPVKNAIGYVVECSPDPAVPDGFIWKQVGMSTKAQFTGNGATAGRRCWYRVAGFNVAGQGVWSDPALREVM